MVGLDDARAIADEYAKRTGSHWFEADLAERDTYWVARVGFVGSSGIVIDKTDGRVTVLGSAYSLADWLWGYEKGLLEVDGTLRVLAVHEEEQTVELLCAVAAGGPAKSRNPWPRRTWVREHLTELPVDFRWQGDLGLAIPSFQAVEAQGWFDFEVIRSE